MIGRKEGCSSAKQAAMERSGVTGCLGCASSVQRVTSHSFIASKFVKRANGVKSHSRILPIWFSTCPFSQPDAGVQATGSNK